MDAHALEELLFDATELILDREDFTELRDLLHRRLSDDADVVGAAADADLAPDYDARWGEIEETHRAFVARFLTMLPADGSVPVPMLEMPVMESVPSAEPTPAPIETLPTPAPASAEPSIPLPVPPPPTQIPSDELPLSGSADRDRRTTSNVTPARYRDAGEKSGVTNAGYPVPMRLPQAGQ